MSNPEPQTKKWKIMEDICDLSTTESDLSREEEGEEEEEGSWKRRKI